MGSTTAVVVFLVAIIVSIMIHEWGHFFFARRFGMRADRFFLGFGPTLWSTRRGETEYGVKAIPAGGFVRIKGMSPEDERLRPVADAVFDREVLAEERRVAAERHGVDVLEQPAITDGAWDRLDAELAARGTGKELRQRIVNRTRNSLTASDTPAEARQRLTEVIITEVPDTERVGDLHHRLLRGDEDRFFADRPAWQRAIVLAAGSGLHFVQAFVLLLVGFLLFGSTGLVAQVDQFTEDSVAEAAGLEVGDRILAVDGEPIDDFAEARELIRANPGEQIALVVERNGQQVRLQVTPQSVTDEQTGQTVGQLGFLPATEGRPMSPGDALYETFVGEASVPAQTVMTFKALGRVFGPEGIGKIFSQVAGETERTADGAISLPGAARAAGQGTAQMGLLFLFLLVANINVFIGVFNILPLPPLDGGHLAVLGVERGVNAVRRWRGEPQDFKVDPRAIATIAVPVIVLLITVGGALMWLDVTNPVNLP